MADYKSRIIRAAKLDVHLYEEVEADATANVQAFGVVVLSSLAAGIGLMSEKGAGAIVAGTIGALITWYLWAYITYYVGTKLFPEPSTQADPGQLLRTIGFSTAPGLIRIVGIIPFLTSLVYFIAAIWMLVAMIIAVRQALDYTSTMRAAGVCFIGWIVQVILAGIFFALF